MRKFARIATAKVVEIFDLDEHFPERPGIEGLFHPDNDWRACPHNCAEGWVLHEGQLLAPDDYRVLRAVEYPPMRDFVDAMVKVHSNDAEIQAAGDAQVAAYCEACLEVKTKYPKPG